MTTWTNQERRAVAIDAVWLVIAAAAVLFGIVHDSPATRIVVAVVVFADLARWLWVGLKWLEARR